MIKTTVLEEKVYLNPVPGKESAAAPVWRGLRLFLVCSAVLAACYFNPLLKLAQLAFANELYSHLFLMPAIATWLIWLRRRDWEGAPGFSAAGAICVIFGGVLLFLSGEAGDGAEAARRIALALQMLSLVAFIFAAGFFCLGVQAMKVVGYPLAMLLFLAPFPFALEHGIEVFFQRTSAEVAAGFFGLTSIPVFREGLVFHLPGISIQVAEECSGIRSSLVLFITSLVAGHLFFRSPWNRAVLAFLVVPLGIIRNGFRIFTIGILCVEIGPGMINSPIHRRGGPIFFALSLIPFLFLLFWLRKREAVREGSNPIHSGAPGAGAGETTGNAR